MRGTRIERSEAEWCLSDLLHLLLAYGGDMNLLEETKEILEENGKTIFDVLWFGTKEAVFDVDIQKLFSVDYDDGFGGQEIPSELIVVGEDWWLERHEYDGSEWWEFKTMPVKPTAIKQGANLLQRWQ